MWCSFHRRELSIRTDCIVQTIVRQLYRGRGRVVYRGRGRIYDFVPSCEL